MIAVVDAGSTKADWRFFDKNGNSDEVNTMGFNPFFHSSDKIGKELLAAFNGNVQSDIVQQVFYYGAGCSDRLRCSIVEEGLKIVFKNAVIDVDHDILAAARATCKDEPGIACILGTGSNSCAFDGEQVVDNITNLGFLLGDEGSGSHLGKMLIQGYFYREFPEDIKTAFEAQFPLSKRDFLNRIYGEESVNVYLASFAKFISAHKDHFYIQQLVSNAFGEFIKRHVSKYKDHTKLPIHFIGSIAFHFANILKTVLAERNLVSGLIIKKPIDNLLQYHIEKDFITSKLKS